jgi:predicted Zn-dependent peptidase
MIDFERIDGPCGVPVYYQRLPVNTVSIYWLVFVGSADDDAAGGHGLYHWFEHLPSRGTEKYPGGYFDTEARLVRHGGGGDAETGHSHTAFSVAIPKRVWPDALDILTDMIARPLLRTEDIEAEREIILQEIDEWHSAPYSHSVCQLPGVLWPKHPLGHDQLGTAESLMSMNAAMLRHAHASGYSRNRCALFVAGDIDRGQLMDVITPCIERLPATKLTPRQRPAEHGPLPAWKAGQTTIIESPHEDSVVYLLFPIPSQRIGINELMRWDFLSDVFSAGDLGSPLNRLIREDSHLAYSPDFISTTHPDGGYAGLVAQTSVEPQRVLAAFWNLIRSPEIRSASWLDYVRDTIRGSIEMHDPDACEYTEQAASSLLHYGEVFSDQQYASAMLGFTNQQVAESLERLTASQAHAIVFRGHG